MSFEHPITETKNKFKLTSQSWNLQRWICGSCCLLGLLINTAVHAQDGKPASSSATSATGDKWYSINPEAWYSFRSFDSERIFGKWEDQELHFNLKFDSEYVVWGRKLAQQTWIPSIEQRGPLFGGEGYLEFEAVLPHDSESAQFFAIKGGWKYSLTPVIDLDVGGDFVYINKPVIGPGIPASIGDKEQGPLYFGLINNSYLTPSIYLIYEPILEQTIVLGGVTHTWEIPIDGLSFEASGNIGWLNADSWQGKSPAPTGGDLDIEYVYWQISGDLHYRLSKSFTTSIGVRYSGNDAGSNQNLGGIDLGPDQQIWMSTEITLSF